jgi:hypothetical protein
MELRDLALFRFPPCSLGLFSLILVKSIKSSTEGYRGGSSSGVKTVEARGSHVISNSQVYWSVSSAHPHQLQRDRLATATCRDDLSTCDPVNILFCFGCCLILAFSDRCCSRLLGIGIHSNCLVGFIITITIVIVVIVIIIILVTNCVIFFFCFSELWFEINSNKY